MWPLAELKSVLKYSLTFLAYWLTCVPVNSLGLFLFPPPQNHNFAVDPATLPEGVEVTHVNLNDGTCAGLTFPAMQAMSIQYHPESSPGPHDSDQGEIHRLFSLISHLNINGFFSFSFQ